MRFYPAEYCTLKLIMALKTSCSMLNAVCPNRKCLIYTKYIQEEYLFVVKNVH